MSNQDDKSVRLDSVRLDSVRLDPIKLTPDPIRVGRGVPFRRVAATSYGPAAYSEDIEYNKTKVEIKLTPDPIRAEGGGGPCPFGRLLTTTNQNGDAEAKLLGGLVLVGDKNFTVPDTDVGSLKISKTLQYYLEIPVEVNRDDANEIFLSGVKTSSGTAATLVKNQPWTETSQYPDNTRPLLGTGIGKIIVPLGKLVIDGPNESATFTRVGCGDVLVNHCTGTLSYTRV